MVLRVLTEPDDALHARCAEVGDIDSDVMRLACDMADTMYADGGVGLAAPQVGCLLRLVVIDTGYPLTGRREPSVLVNPEIVVADGGTFRMDESCLSFPGADAVVARPAHVVVTYTRASTGGTASSRRRHRSCRHVSSTSSTISTA